MPFSKHNSAAGFKDPNIKRDFKNSQKITSKPTTTFCPQFKNNLGYSLDSQSDIDKTNLELSTNVYKTFFSDHTNFIFDDFVAAFKLTLNGICLLVIV